MRTKTRNFSIRRGRWTDARQPWSHQEIERAIHLRVELKWDWPEIGQELHRTQMACEVKVNDTLKRRGQSRFQIVTNNASDEVLLERERRAEAEMLRTPTQIFCGDPPPGFSALDRKLREANK